MDQESRLHERVLLERRCMEVYCTAHPLEVLRNRLDRHGAVTAAGLKQTPSGRTVLIAGLVIFFHTPPTRSGRRIIFATLEDETGLADAVIPPDVQERWGRIIYTSEVLAIRGRLKRQGRGGLSISVTAKYILPGLSGSFSRLAEAAAQ